MARILHVTHAHAGGVSRAIELAVASTPENEHHIAWSGKEAPSNGVFASQLRLPFPNPLVVRKLTEYARSISPEVVHAHSSWAGLSARISQMRAPILYQPHCYKFDDPSLSRALKFAFRAAETVLSRRSVGSIALTPHEAGLALRVNKDQNIYRLDNASANHPEARDRTLSRSSTLSVVMIGRVADQKDPGYFARVFFMVREQLPEVEFIWIGDGPEAAVARLQNAGVQVTGWLSAAELVDILSSSDAYLHTASYEGFPLSILDAAATRLPIVARDLPSLRGYGLCLVDSPDEAAANLVQLLSDDNRYSLAVRRSIDLANDMSRANHERQLRAIYANVLSRKDEY